MARIDVVVDVGPLDRKLTKFEQQQLPFARSLAANTAAFQTMGTMRRAAGLFIQAPTPFTVQAIRYRKGTKQAPAAEVYLSGDALKGTPASRYLTITRGGTRGQRRSERLLVRAGLIEPTEGWVPARALKLNRYGNPSPATIVQILSSIKAFGEQGFSANATARSRRRGRARARSEYFFVRAGQALPRGVYERYGTGRRKVRPVLLIVPLPQYGKQFDFVALTSAELRRRFVEAWPPSLRRALATAR